MTSATSQSHCSRSDLRPIRMSLQQTEPFLCFNSAIEGYEGKLLADRLTLEYLGRGTQGDRGIQAPTSHPIDAMSAFIANHKSPIFNPSTFAANPLAYYEVVILATEKEDPSNRYTDDSEDPGIRRLQALGKLSLRWKELEGVVWRNGNTTQDDRSWRKQMQWFIQTNVHRKQRIVSNFLESGKNNARDEAKEQSDGVSEDETLGATVASNTEQSGPLTLQWNRGSRINSATSRDHHTSSQLHSSVQEDLDCGIRVGFLYKGENATVVHDSKTGSGSRNRSRLGSDECSIGYEGSTGHILARGKIVSTSCTPFGTGDTVGCGVLMDSRTFFFTLNGKVECFVDVTDVNHLLHFADEVSVHEGDPHNEEEEEKESTQNPQSKAQMKSAISKWSLHVYGAIGLNGPGECVHAVFIPSLFTFDLQQFIVQVTQQRHRSLSSWAHRQGESYVMLSAFPLDRVRECGNSGKRKSGSKESLSTSEDDILQRFIADYLLYYGYPETFGKLQKRCHKNPSSERIQADARGESAPFRQQIRKLIYEKQTYEALEKMSIASMWPPASSAELETWQLLFHCDILCFLDILSPSEAGMYEMDAFVRAIIFARESWYSSSFLNDRDPEEIHSERYQQYARDIGAFLGSIVTNKPQTPQTQESYSHPCPFLHPVFREEVADMLNSYLLYTICDQSPSRCAMLDTFMRDLKRLRLGCFHQNQNVFPKLVPLIPENACEENSVDTQGIIDAWSSTSPSTSSKSAKSSQTSDRSDRSSSDASCSSG
uniref:AlNc14C80G5261 protein n=1 Tax=Albugo laibachii Nc14 TaxID=890382 RepID=F0WF67_9STRA|nr:AlNc14C80G5261 [Albugo laibachii Nc14]|eukprot:CCA19849.1 AlNc14C80G5261 [Albugo laibachii Nc14]